MTTVTSTTGNVIQCLRCGAWYAGAHTCPAYKYSPISVSPIFTTTQPYCDHCFCQAAPRRYSTKEPHAKCCKCQDVKAKRFVPELKA